MVPTPTIFTKDPSIRLKRKKLVPIVDISEGRKERAITRKGEAEGGEDTPHR